MVMSVSKTVQWYAYVVDVRVVVVRILMCNFKLLLRIKSYIILRLLTSDIIDASVHVCP